MVTVAAKPRMSTQKTATFLTQRKVGVKKKMNILHWAHGYNELGFTCSAVKLHTCWIVAVEVANLSEIGVDPPVAMLIGIA